MDLGVYGSYPVSRHFLIGSKLLIGRRMNANFSLNSVCRINPQIFDRRIVSEEAYKQFYQEDVTYYMQQEDLTHEDLLQNQYVDDDFLSIRKSSTWKIGTGISLTCRYKEDAAFRLFCDYDFASPRLTYDLKNTWTDEEGKRPSRSYSRRTPMHNVTFGGAIVFVF